MGHAHRFVSLTETQDAELATLEQAPGINPKVRLRASIIRLNAKHHPVAWLCKHFNRSRKTILDDLNRFEQHGLAGLPDGRAPGQPAKITPEIAAFLETKLSQDQTWNCTMLATAIRAEFKLEIDPDTIRVKLLELGYSWKRGRYAPGKTPDAGVVAQHKVELDQLKKGHWIRRSGSSTSTKQAFA